MWGGAASIASFIFGVTGLPWWSCLIPMVALVHEMRHVVLANVLTESARGNGSPLGAIFVAFLAGFAWALVFWGVGWTLGGLFAD